MSEPQVARPQAPPESLGHLLSAHSKSHPSNRCKHFLQDLIWIHIQSPHLVQLPPPPILELKGLLFWEGEEVT